jgi:hypothetical protein
VVDWLQKIYQGGFVVNEQTGETVLGRYYWAAEGAQVWPHPHVFGSAVFLDREERGHGKIGDQFRDVSYIEMPPPNPYPFTKLKSAGLSPDCCGSSPWEIVPTESEQFQQLPKSCFPPGSEEVFDSDLRDHWWDLHHPALVVGTVLHYLEDFDSDKESDILSVLNSYIFSLEGIRTFWGDDSDHPRWVMWKSKHGRGLLIGGTRSNLDLARQMFGAGFGPVPCGRFYSLRQWYNRAVALNAEWEDFAGPHVAKSFVGGFSQGGAIAANIMANFSNVVTKPQWRMQTFGAPRYGNQHMHDYLGTDRVWNYQLWDDPVPAIPPSYPTFFDLYPVLGPLWFFFMQRFGAPPVRWIRQSDDTWEFTDQYANPAFPMDALAAAIAAGAAWPDFPAHYMSAYVDALGGAL